MRKFVMLLLGAGMLFFTSCFDIIEEVHLNKDGSGKYVMKIDASGLFSNPFMKSAMEEAAKEEGGEEMNMEQDSFMYYKDMPGYADLTADEQAKVQDLSMRMQMSESKSEFLITNEIPFKSFEDLLATQKIISKIQEKEGDEDGGGGFMGGGNPFGGNTTPMFQLKKRELVRLPDQEKEEDDLDKETMDMARMFLGDAKSTTIYYLPGKVKSCSIENAVVDGRTVTVNNSVLDLLDKKVKVEGAIKYKRR